MTFLELISKLQYNLGIKKISSSTFKVENKIWIGYSNN
jgi:hypothetical protein